MEPEAREYYTLRREIEYRVRDIFLAVDDAFVALQGYDLKDVADLLSSIHHSAEMIENAFKESQDRIDKDTEKMFEEINRQGIINAAGGF